MDGSIATGGSSSILRLSNRCTRNVAYSISTSSGAVTVAFVPAVLVLLALELLLPPLPSLLDEQLDELLLLLGRVSALLLLSRPVGLLQREQTTRVAAHVNAHEGDYSYYIRS